MKKILIFLLLPHFLNAQEILNKTDFAYGQEITFLEQKSVVEILLPEELYLTSKNLNLLDVAVFNSSGETVPHSILNLESKEIKNTKPPQVATVFPIFGDVNAKSALSHIKVSTTTDGAVIEISSNQATGIKKDRIEAYLIDASKIQDPIEKFQIEFTHTNKNKLYNMKVEGSEDLKNWTTIVDRAVVAWFEMNKQSVVQDTVAVFGKNHKFYRISMPENEFGFYYLDKITIHFASEFSRQDLQTFKKTVPGKKIETANKDSYYLYNLGGSFPIIGLSVNFKDNNSLAQLSIQGAHNEDGPWINVTTKHFFTMTKNGKKFEYLNTVFDKNKFQFWKLQLMSDVSGIGKTWPEVTFTWQPHRLLFLARGDAPFVLAYGSAKTVATSQTDFSQFGTEDKVAATLKNQISLGGNSQLVVSNETPLNYRKYILWAILLLGVVSIGYMALSVKKNTSQ